MKQVKGRLVPKLRFKEFVNEKEWEEKIVEELFNLQDGYAFSSDEFIDNSINSFQVIRITDINSKNKNKDKIYIPRHLVEKSEFKKFTVKKGDLLLSLTGAAGFNFFIWDEDSAIINQRTMKISLKDSSNDSLKTLLGPLIYDKINIKGSGQNNNLSKESLRNIKLLIPAPSEQQKIADCLSSLDELIDAEDKKLEALQRHKKGLMQELFPAEGQTLPKLRFPEFASDGEWEESNIGSLGNFYYGKSAPKWSLEKNAPTPCVRYGELYTKYGPIITKTYSRTNIKTTELKFSKGGEILIPRVGEKPEDFGKNCCYLPLKNIAIGEMISVFETQQNPLFYTYYFRSIYKEFAKVVEGQNVKNLYYAELEPLTVFRPLLPEQQKIADFLSSIDDLITSQTKKLESLRLHKKGLMQQLFPNICEVKE